MSLYRTFDSADLRIWLSTQITLSAQLGGKPEEWSIKEVSDGNLNSVFLVHGSESSLCCKQALPHVRVAPDWPMPLERALYEARYMRATEAAVTGLAPKLFHYDADLFLLVMECLSPHTVLRSALIADQVTPGFSETIGQYVAQTVHTTGWTTRPFEEGSRLLADFAGNTALTRITVDLILNDPYRVCTRNPEPEPALLSAVEALRTDRPLHAAISRLQNIFLTCRQALLHGDLHTGSIMLHERDVRVIDGEFATMGPIGFDCGLYLGNLALHACAAPQKMPAMEHEIRVFWAAFAEQFQTLVSQGGGDVGDLLEDDAARLTMVQNMLLGILRDTAGFAGLEIIRRTIGFAQVADYSLCPDDAARTTARKRALEIGRTLIMSAEVIESPDALFALLCPSPATSAPSLT